MALPASLAKTVVDSVRDGGSELPEGRSFVVVLSCSGTSVRSTPLRCGVHGAESLALELSPTYCGPQHVDPVRAWSFLHEVMLEHLAVTEVGFRGRLKRRSVF